jgi:DMSO/TMAO reductase YedYZ molybdopterin-dependent catalytic subunit
MSERPRLPPGQQIAAAGKWPLVGERVAAPAEGPWTIHVDGLVDAPRTWTLEQLRTLPWIERAIDIHCVTRWSKFDVRFGGVLFADLLAESRLRPDARFVSFVAHSVRGHSTSLALDEAIALETMVALEADGQAIAPEHGGPVRVVTPGKYFYKSLKWLRRIEVLAEDRLGYWEAEAGYHNGADPWREQRFLAATLSRHEMREVLASRTFAGRDLRSIDAAGHDLERLNAQSALLRNADFSRAKLWQASFQSANLSNAHFERADLRDANLRNADVEGADFVGADLRGADFRGASLIGATFLAASAESGAPPLQAVIDRTTQFDPRSLDDLMPEQAEFVRRMIGSQRP